MTDHIHAIQTFSTSQTVEMVGCSYRQLDYWIRTGTIPSTNRMLSTGSGRYREIPDWYIPRLKVIVGLQKLTAANNGFDRDILRRVFDEYKLGGIDFNGVGIRWEVE